MYVVLLVRYLKGIRKHKIYNQGENILKNNSSIKRFGVKFVPFWSIDKLAL